MVVPISHINVGLVVVVYIFTLPIILMWSLAKQQFGGLEIMMSFGHSFCEWYRLAFLKGYM